MQTIKTDICIIGAGSGGLSVAAGASQMGADVVLIEKDKMGGDCLNTGCVPSKALLAAAHAAHTAKDAAKFGVHSTITVDFSATKAHVQAVIDGIAPHDSVERFEGYGCKVIQAAASFSDAKTVHAGDYAIQARRFVIATGSRAFVPAITGLDTVPYYTNETLFAEPRQPEHLLIIGGGPIGLEMAQAHSRLGSKVTLLDLGSIAPHDDPELVQILRTQLQSEGIALLENVTTQAISGSAGNISIEYQQDGTTCTVTGTDLLVAAGRQVNVEGLNLTAANIEFSRKGIVTNAKLRTTNRKIFAIGDVAGGPQFTHVAGYHAGIVIRQALLRLPAKVNYKSLPWVTYTDPELAQTGLTEAQAREKYGDSVTVLKWSFAENDRARAELQTNGLIKVMSRKGRVLGASIIGPHAGELIQNWTLAIDNKIKISKMAGYISPYPTLTEVNKRAAGSAYTETLYGSKMKKLVGFLSKFG